jgi:Spx/MgsR family transcriptional regulator
MYKIYGIKNCDTVKKSLALLDRLKITYEFIDYKKVPPEKGQILRWKEQLGHWPVNTKGPIYRKIKEEFEAASDSNKIALLLENSSAIKRPLIEKNEKIVALGFDEVALKKLV